MRENRTWLDDYGLFSTIHEQLQKSWLDWAPGLRDRTPDAIADLRRKNDETLLEHSWLQWQLDEQWRKARRETSEIGVDLMGDLPFTVAMDSSDVWANRGIFRTDLRVGTPPEGEDAGQDWGLPVYDWMALQRSDFGWLRARASRAGDLFSLYRIDHVAGFYRTFFRSADGKSSGFAPADERSQVRLGETVMRLMRHFGEVVGEDLGNVPSFLRPSLDRMGVPGFRVLRWEKDGDDYRDPGQWPQNSVAATSTHDTEGIADWWDHLSEDERAALLKITSLKELDPKAAFDDHMRDALLRAVYATPSTLAIVPLQDAMGTRERINVPGTVAESNWSYRMAGDVDTLQGDAGNTERLAKLAEETGRSAGE
jgi:4-alpha-glucanotransferase